MPPPAGTAKPYDGTPFLPAAGLGATRDEALNTAERILKPDIYAPEAPVPEELKKWRKQMEPGQVCLHPGVADDADHERLEVYGKADPVGVKVHEVLNIAPKSYLIEKATEKKESIYLSHKREPLGKPYVRGHVLPGEFASGEKGFGRACPQDVSGDQSKWLLHPKERVVPEDERQLYVKSHANYDPGEQRHRGYNWVNEKGPIDPALFRFGMKAKDGMLNGVGKAMNPALDDDYKRPAIVVDKKLEDFRVVASEKIGQIKNLGFGPKTVGPAHVYGMPSQSGPEWGVRECIGNYTPEEQEPDPDLGRSIRPGWRNLSANEARVFGVPSIRSDIPAPALKSVADHQNYGDEAGAASILYPPRFTDGGVTQADFLTATSKPEIADIFRCAGIELDDATVDKTYELAKKLDANGLVSVQSFRMALNGEVA